MRNVLRWSATAGVVIVVVLFVVTVLALAPATAGTGPGLSMGRVSYVNADPAAQEPPAEFQFYLPLVLRVFVFQPTLTPTPTETPVVVQPRLAYESKANPDGSSYEIYAVDADGTNLVNVSNRADGDFDPDWSPDGTQIAWVHGADASEEIYAANADGSNARNLTNSAGQDRAPDWSPDGTKIAFHSHRAGRYEVYVMNADGSNQVKLTDHLCQSHDPVWSPDGTKIAYVCGLTPYEEVYILNVDDPDSWTRVTNDYVPDRAITWAPNSRRLAYVHFPDEADSEIWVYNLDTGASAQITKNDRDDYSPDWSPDGQLIVFSTWLDGNFEIATMYPDGTNLVNVTRTAGGDYVPRWSRDGKMIAFVSTRDGNNELYVMKADGTGQRRLTQTEIDEGKYPHDWRP